LIDSSVFVQKILVAKNKTNFLTKRQIKVLIIE